VRASGERERAGEMKAHRVVHLDPSCRKGHSAVVDAVSSAASARRLVDESGECKEEEVYRGGERGTHVLAKRSKRWNLASAR